MNEEENIQVEEKKEKKNNKKCIIIVVAIMIIAAITAGVLYFLNNKDDKDKTKTNTNKVENKKVSEYKLTGNDLQEFDLAFLKLENKEENKVYSPLSIKYTLEMLAEASNGETKEQINSIIGDYKARKYENNSNMSFANMMFIKDSFKDSIKDSYTSKITNKYNGEVIYDSFRDATNINKKISDKTFSLIDKMVEDSAVQSKDYYLVNALAIDMYWNYKIQAANGPEVPNMLYYMHYSHESENGKPYAEYINPITTENGYPSLAFNNNKVNAKAVEIGSSINNYDIIKELGEDRIRQEAMANLNEYCSSGHDYICDDKDKVINDYVKEIGENYHRVDVSTDYKMYTDDSVNVFAKELQKSNGTTLEYIGIMPKQDNLKSYIDKLTAKDLNELIGSLKEIKPESFAEGKVYKIVGTIPLFNMNYDLQLTDDLKQLGITDIFDETKADLSNLTSKENAFIAGTDHSATIEFSNLGIKAAAVTEGGGLGDTHGWDYYFDIPVEIIDLTFDNPYMFIIRDKATGEVWFTGTVYTPTEK